MKKQIIFLSTLIFISCHLYARKGATVVNKTNSTIKANIQKGKYGFSTLKKGESKFLESKTGGKRAIYWHQNGYFYETPQYTYLGTIFIKDNGIFDIKPAGLFTTLKKNLKAKMTAKLIGNKVVPIDKEIPSKKTDTNKKKIITKKPPIKKTPIKPIDPEKKPTESKIIKIIKLPKSSLDAAKEIYNIFGVIEKITNQLLKESDRIKVKTKLIGQQKKISQKLDLATDILGENIRPFVIQGIYPLMDSLVKLLDQIGNNIVSIFDKKTAESIINAAKTIKSLRTKSSKQKTIVEYLDVIEKITFELTKFLKNTKWIKN